MDRGFIKERKHLPLPHITPFQSPMYNSPLLISSMQGDYSCLKKSDPISWTTAVSVTLTENINVLFSCCQYNLCMQSTPRDQHLCCVLKICWNINYFCSILMKWPWPLTLYISVFTEVIWVATVTLTFDLLYFSVHGSNLSGHSDLDLWPCIFQCSWK